MTEHRLMELTLLQDAGPEVRALVDKWNEALAAQLDFMNRHPPTSREFSEQERGVMDLPMLAFLSFIVPLMYDAEQPRRVRRMWLAKMDARLALAQQQYAELRNAGRIQ